MVRTPKKHERPGATGSRASFVETRIVGAGPPRIARLVTLGRPSGSVRDAEWMLLDMFERWPHQGRTAFLLLPGGFVRSPWPKEWSGKHGWASRPCDFEAVAAKARSVSEALVSPRVRRAAKGRVRSIIVGIDSSCEETGSCAELITAHDLVEERFYVTGKSLPRSDQRRVVRVAELASHFVRIVNDRAMLLGCHDLNLFSPRGRGRQTPGGHLEELRKAFDDEVRRFRPNTVLHLPHGTDTPRTWTSAWNALGRAVPGISTWASGISFYNIRRRQRPRATLDDVLDSTRSEASQLDFVYRVHGARRA
jgi:hypothetical protein